MRSGSSDPTVAPRHSTTQRRLLTVSAGFGVAALTGVAFVLSYDDLRALALAGRAVTRYAPAYPIMYDALVVVTILSLLVARNARWWSRWTRWLLLLILLTGAAAASIQRAIQGYDSLPGQAVVAGVAAAPHVMLVIAVWLWLAMFRQARSALARRGAAPRLGPVAKVAEEIPVHAGYPTGDLVPGMRETTESAEYAAHEVPRSTAFADTGPGFEDTEPSVRILRDADEPNLAEIPENPVFQEPHYAEPRGPRPEYPDDEERAERHSAVPDVRLIDRPPAIRAATTRPDIVMPDALDSAEDDVDAPGIERAEDPDAGDGEPVGGMSRQRPEPSAEDRPRDPEAALDDIFDPALNGACDDIDGTSDGDVDHDVERWSVTAAEDAQRWADDAADSLSDDDSGFTTERPPEVEWPPSSTFRSSPTPPTG